MTRLRLLVCLLCLAVVNPALANVTSTGMHGATCAVAMDDGGCHGACDEGCASAPGQCHVHCMPALHTPSAPTLPARTAVDVAGFRHTPEAALPPGRLLRPPISA